LWYSVYARYCIQYIVHKTLFYRLNECCYILPLVSYIQAKILFSGSLNNWCIWSIMDQIHQLFNKPEKEIWIRYISYSINLKNEYLLIYENEERML
jgi:hypothetical protein